VTDDGLRVAAEAVFHGVNLAELGSAPLVDTTTTCPNCGHHEATFDFPAEPTGFVETRLRCDHTFVDPTP
jgi:hypothetical protein